ncbi:MAG: hypothetical protein ABI426_00525 [Flavobacterium sp.]
MNKLKNISVYLLLFTAVFFTSCSGDIEPYEGTIPNANPTDNTGGGGGGQSTGDYWPTAINNQWIFSVNGTNQAPMKMVSLDNIGGNNYYTFNAQSGGGATQVTRLRKSNGDYYIKSEDVVIAPQPGIPGSTSTGTERILLKDYLDVGGTWTYNYVQTTTYTDPQYPVISMNFNIVSTIVEKNTTLNVNGQNYTNVIKVRVVQNVTNNGQTSVATSYYHFSKNVGPIKITTEYNGTTSNQDLASYNLY